MKCVDNQGIKMLKRELKKKVKILETLPPKKTKNMSFIDDYEDGKIHIICEACYNIVNKKNTIRKEERKQTYEPADEDSQRSSTIGKSKADTEN